MDDFTLGLFTKTRSSHARLNVPALVQVAAFAIILIRGLDLLMILNQLGVQGIADFVHRSVQTWALTLVFLASLALVFIEIWCAFSLVKGRNWARWLYLLTHGFSACNNGDTIPAPVFLKVFLCIAHFTTRAAAVPVSGWNCH